ncbi:hypothetical protein [Candidatus Anaplasma sp. TIGMIC]|uniref:hypothetical protein n=1 Tax=Candidatus Anaplasma sp. TIGMIC TaxID=3020713 RepID=UPI00232CB724|nr:hypothetical protein [Candidatus Anaplasma sp. TIGMIC]MDB1135671.1 hypothetical protein [Candidatus Anaplasma sp. TIGMIC]
MKQRAVGTRRLHHFSACKGPGVVFWPMRDYKGERSKQLIIVSNQRFYRVDSLRKESTAWNTAVKRGSSSNKREQMLIAAFHKSFGEQMRSTASHSYLYALSHSAS